MQQENRRTNRDRADSTRALLVGAARRLFIEKGYAETGTPEIVAAAGVTRGALYHHFTDKAALFRAVVEHEARALAAAIEAATADGADPVDTIVLGGEAYLEAIVAPGRARLLLVEAPAVLGRHAVDAIDAESGGRTLEEGLRAAAATGRLRDVPVAESARLLSAAYDRAAVAIGLGEDAAGWRRALEMLVRGLERAPG